MHRRGSLLFALAAQLMLPLLASAQTLTLERAISLALSAHPDLQAVAAAEAEAREHRAAARAAWYPRLVVQEEWQRGNQPVFVFGSLLNQRRFTEADFAVAALNHPDPLNNFRAAVGLSQSLFDGGATAAGSRAAETELSLAATARRGVSADVAVAVAQQYGRVLVAEAGARAAAAAIDTAIEDAARAGARRDVGSATDADVLSLEVHLARMRARHIDLSSETQIARAALNRLIGSALDEHWDLTAPPPQPRTPLDTAMAEAGAVRDRPEVVAAALRVDLAQAQSTTARAALLPRVSAEGGYEWNGGTWNSRASSWVLGVRAQWSVSLAGGERRTWQAAERAADRARAEHAAAESAARLDLRNAIARLDAARARLDVAAVSVAQARESERIIRDRYEAGLTTVTEVLRAADASLDADALNTAARIDVHVAGVMLERALGRVPDGQP